MSFKGIAPLYGINEEDGQIFFTSKTQGGGVKNNLLQEKVRGRVQNLGN
jgi:hypothetical protein